MKTLQTALSLVTATAITLSLSGCAEWDNPTQHTTNELAESLQTTGDPHQAQGVAMVSEISEVEPIDTPREQALPVDCWTHRKFLGTVACASARGYGKRALA